MTKRNKNFLTLAILFIVFFGPMLIAGYLYYSHDLVGNRTTNHGELLPPSVAMTGLNTEGHWVLLAYNPGPCQDACLANLYKMRQIRLATGKDQDRILRVVVAAQIEQAQQGLLNSRYHGTVLLAKNTVGTTIPLQSGYLYIVDPLGNMVLAYGPQVQAKGILQDLQKLLRVSQIG